MIEILKKIISFSKKNKTYVGASLDELKHLELKLGYILPKGYDDLYKTTNGGTLFNSELLEIMDVINLLNNSTEIEKEDLIVIPDNYVKKVITYKGRIPLFKEKDNYIFIDLDTGTKGINGQIVLFYNNTYKVIANNVIDFFDKLLDNIDEIYKTNLFKYLVENNISFLNENDRDTSIIKLEKNKVNVEIFNPENNIFEKEIVNKKLSKELFTHILESFKRIENTFNSRLNEQIIIFDLDQNHNKYTYYEFEDLYNQNNYTITDANEYATKLNDLNLDILKRMDFKLGYSYQIDDKNNRRFISTVHRLEIYTNRNSIKIKYVFNIKEPYFYNEVLQLLNYINNLNDENTNVKLVDESFKNLDINLINQNIKLLLSDAVKYKFDGIDERKINYNILIRDLLRNIEECNWIDPIYAEKIMEVESKNIKDLTIEELKVYFSSIIRREKLESGYIAILIDRGIFESLLTRLKYYKDKEN